jgi:hypothetical protein
MRDLSWAAGARGGQRHRLRPCRFSHVSVFSISVLYFIWFYAVYLVHSRSSIVVLAFSVITACSRRRGAQPQARHTRHDRHSSHAEARSLGHWSERSRRQPQAGRAEAGPHPGGPARQTNRDGCRRNVCAHVPRTGTRAAAADATRQWRRYGRRAIMYSRGLRECTVSRQSARASCPPWCDLSIGRRLARALSLAQSVA